MPAEYLETPLRTLLRVWRGEIGWNDALRADRVTLAGQSDLCRRLPDWFRLSPFATAATSRATQGAPTA